MGEMTTTKISPHESVYHLPSEIERGILYRRLERDSGSILYVRFLSSLQTTIIGQVGLSVH